ncbi:MAG: class I adenylate-forming enzyme family protein [Halobacteriota archaeon]|nr:class I adenylate-forming enzyme family protein [Halobacteriota archaeon]
MPLGDFLIENVELIPDKEAVVCGNKRLTWKELNDRANCMGNALIDMGIKKGDKVAVLMYNQPEFIETLFAMHKTGIAPAPVNYRYVGEEIEYIVGGSDSVALIFVDEFLETVRSIQPKLSKVKNFICVGKSPDDMIDYEELVQKYPNTPPDVEVTDDDIACVYYTGGTTGMPKGAVLLHDNIMKDIPAIFGKIMSDPRKSKQSGSKSQKMLLGTPLFHEAAYGVLIAAFLTGSTSILLTGKKFDPVELMETIDRETVNWVLIVPTMTKRLLELPNIGDYNVRSWGILVSTGMVFPAALKKKFLETFRRVVIVDAYGQTELSPLAMVEISTYASRNKIKDRCIGTPVDVIEAKVVNERGEDVKPGETGELVLKGDIILKEYYGDAKKTSERIKDDGWYHTGDLCTVGDDGKFYIAERKEETIISGGEKIYPHEIEEMILTNPKVREAAVIAVPDPNWGQSGRAIIQLKDGEKATEEEIIDFLKGKIAGYKKPRSVVFVEEFEMNAIGKVLRGPLREKYGN